MSEKQVGLDSIRGKLFSYSGKIRKKYHYLGPTVKL